MKRLIRLVLISALGMVGIIFVSRNSLLARMRSLECTEASAQRSRVSSAENYAPVLLTEWLASDVLKINALPAWIGTEGVAAETMQAYAELHDARQDSEALIDEQKKAIKHRQNKELLIQRLVAREIHLLDAANGWFELDRSYGKAKASVMSRVYSGHTEIERYCQRVLRELELCSREHPKPYSAALVRAQAEFRQLQFQGSFLSSN
jgi:hypothetical protein